MKIKALLPTIFISVISNDLYATSIPTCVEPISEHSWNQALIISGASLWYNKIGVCRLHNEKAIKYNALDFITNNSIKTDNNSPQIRNLNGANTIVLNNSLNVQEPALKKIPDFYLQKNKNHKGSPVGNEGLFRFYTLVGGNSSCDRDRKGYEHLEYWLNDDFFSKLQINNIWGMAKEVEKEITLTNNGSEIKAGIQFVHGKKQSVKMGNTLCVMDFYIKMKLKGLNSTSTLKNSGEYDLNITFYK